MKSLLTSQRIPQLDGIRAVAIVFVVLFHAYPHQFPGGWIGVDIFFVLSGFLITSILTGELDQTGEIRFARFYWHRCLRLMPPMACVLVFELCRTLYSSHRSDIFLATISGAFYFMNWSRAFNWYSQDIIGHMWSLSIEEQFYLLWPLTLSLIFCRKPVISISTALCVVILWRCWLCFHGAGTDRTYAGFDTHSDGLLLGCLLALTPPWIQRGLSYFCWPSIAVLLFLFFTATIDSAGVQSIGLTISACCGVLLVCGALHQNIFARALRSIPLVFTGRISYGWYLWHWPLLALAHYNAARPLFIAVIVVFSYGVAVMSWFFIEKPIQRYRQLTERGSLLATS